MTPIFELENQLIELNDQAQALAAKGRLTQAEEQQLQQLITDLDATERRLKVAQNTERLGASTRQTPATSTEPPGRDAG